MGEGDGGVRGKGYEEGSKGEVGCGAGVGG